MEFDRIETRFHRAGRAICKDLLDPGDVLVARCCRKQAG